MSYIYKIKNNINDKIYIGKTMKNINKRFKEHCRDSKREDIENIPLYKAMNKYGIENFSVELIEECEDDILSQREIYWIEYYGSFKYGYNATLGGDGKPYCDYDLIYSLYQNGYAIQEIVEITGYCEETCSLALHKKNISTKELNIRGHQKDFHAVAQIDKNTNKIIKVYSSIADAYRKLGKAHSGHIAAVCKGQRKTAYGYIWKYI